MQLVYQCMTIFFNFSPTSNHLHSLQVENCDRNSRLVVDEDDNVKSGLKTKISMQLVCQYMAIFFNFSPTLNHLHSLQVENCDRNSRLVVDEDDNVKSGLKTKISMQLVCQYMAIFFNFSPTSNHLHSLQVENCDNNSRLVVDEDDNVKSGL